MKESWSIVMTWSMEHCDDRFMEHCDDKGHEHCDDSHGALMKAGIVMTGSWAL